MQPRKYERTDRKYCPSVGSLKQKKCSFNSAPLNKYCKEHLKKASATYADMKQRCYNPNHKLFKRYGERGIVITISSIDFYIWFCEEYSKYLEKYGSIKQSINRLDHDKSYSLNNIELIPHKENAIDSYMRGGNFSKWGTKIDEIQSLVIHTFPKQFTKMLSYHYQVKYSTVRNIREGINRKEIFKAIYE